MWRRALTLIKDSHFVYFHGHHYSLFTEWESTENVLFSVLINKIHSSQPTELSKTRNDESWKTIISTTILWHIQPLWKIHPSFYSHKIIMIQNKAKFDKNKKKSLTSSSLHIIWLNFYFIHHRCSKLDEWSHSTWIGIDG